jgi:hypothetical protein
MAGDTSLRGAMSGVCIVGFVAALAFLPAVALRGSRTAADEPQYLLTSISLAEDHDLDIADELATARWRGFAGPSLPRQTEPTADGQEVSPHDPGLPALLAVPVALGGWAGAKVVLAAVNGALAALLVWTARRRFGVCQAVALPAVLAFAVAAPLAVYGAHLDPELPARCASPASSPSPAPRGGRRWRLPAWSRWPPARPG